MASIKLEIVSPDKVVYQEDIAMLIVRSTGGELGILPHHAPLVTGLVPHAMRVKLGDGDEQLVIEFRSADDKIEVTFRHRIERSRIDCDFL